MDVLLREISLTSSSVIALPRLLGNFCFSRKWPGFVCKTASELLLMSFLRFYFWRSIRVRLLLLNRGVELTSSVLWNSALLAFRIGGLHSDSSLWSNRGPLLVYLPSLQLLLTCVSFLSFWFEAARSKTRSLFGCLSLTTRALLCRRCFVASLFAES